MTDLWDVFTLRNAKCLLQIGRKLDLFCGRLQSRNSYIFPFSHPHYAAVKMLLNQTLNSSWMLLKTKKTWAHFLTLQALLCAQFKIFDCIILCTFLMVIDRERPKQHSRPLLVAWVSVQTISGPFLPGHIPGPWIPKRSGRHRPTGWRFPPVADNDPWTEKWLCSQQLWSIITVQPQRSGHTPANTALCAG